jgi:SAM-dependent methyltransferase
VARCVEGILWGGEFRERALIGLLRRYYESRFRRQWQLSEQPPHFFDQRISFFRFGFGEETVGPYSFSRGFFSAEVIEEGDQLLDIGCGDGFFARRFFGERCDHIDAIDIESTAIAAAITRNSAPNITYHLLDAVNQPFPRAAYEVIVWDGALGHFSPDVTQAVLRKIRQSLSPDGVFVGSESLGREGSDHLQFFRSLDDLHRLFQPYFEHIQLRQCSYRGGFGGDFVREEAYWRCSNSSKRLQKSSWQTYSEKERQEYQSRVDLGKKQI